MRQCARGNVRRRAGTKAGWWRKRRKNFFIKMREVMAFRRRTGSGRRFLKERKIFFGEGPLKKCVLFLSFFLFINHSLRHCLQFLIDFNRFITKNGVRARIVAEASCGNFCSWVTDEK